MTIVAVLLIVAGLFFVLVSAVGLVRLPDFFTRVHAVSKSETLGAALVLLGLALIEGFSLTSLKLGVAFVFVFLTNPVGAHLLMRAALSAGVKPWHRPAPGTPGGGPSKGVSAGTRPGSTG